MQKDILTEDIDDIIDPLNRWGFPKEVKNSFDISIAEEYGDTSNPITCKRCGVEFVRKKKKQVFCSRSCVSKYKIKMKQMSKVEGFKEWLDSGADNAYSPEKY